MPNLPELPGSKQEQPWNKNKLSEGKELRFRFKDLPIKRSARSGTTSVTTNSVVRPTFRTINESKQNSEKYLSTHEMAVRKLN